MYNNINIGSNHLALFVQLDSYSIPKELWNKYAVKSFL